MIKFTVPHTLAFVLHTSTRSCAWVWAHWVRKGTTLILYVNFLEPAPTHTLLVFSGQLSREHSVVMSCSTFMTDGKCAACRALLLPSRLHSTSPSSPDHPSTQWRQHFNVSNECDVEEEEEEPLGVEAVERTPHPVHQYCSFTWWKLTLPNIFHRVIGRKDQIPWLDMPTLLPVQMMTQSLLNFSWSLWRRRRSLEALENRTCSRVLLSTRRSCLFSGDKVRSERSLKNTSSSWCNRLIREAWSSGVPKKDMHHFILS